MVKKISGAVTGSLLSNVDTYMLNLARLMEVKINLVHSYFGMSMRVDYVVEGKDENVTNWEKTLDDWLEWKSGKR